VHARHDAEVELLKMAFVFLKEERICYKMVYYTEERICYKMVYYTFYLS